jgi:hypothetical protein
MPKVIPTGFIDCAMFIERTGDVEPYICTFGAKIAVPPFTQDNAIALSNLVGAELKKVLHTTERFTALHVRVGSDGAPLLREVPMSVSGISATERATQNVALVVNKISEVGGRRNRGRMFWPSVGESFVDMVGLLTIAQRDAHQAVFDLFLNGLRGQGGYSQNTDQMVILHTGLPVAPTVVSSLRVERLVGTQRRRLRR